jgi:hypothetical protein
MTKNKDEQCLASFATRREQAFPEEDACAFDGWYTDEADAIAIYKDWCGRYPGWVVTVVEGKEGHMYFGGTHFKQIEHRNHAKP